jgi:hypothetical protein
MYYLKLNLKQHKKINLVNVFLHILSISIRATVTPVTAIEGSLFLLCKHQLGHLFGGSSPTQSTMRTHRIIIFLALFSLLAIEIVQGEENSCKYCILLSYTLSFPRNWNIAIRVKSGKPGI